MTNASNGTPATMADLKQVFETPDGAKFDTKAEAMDHMRLPLVRAQMLGVTGGNEELTDWLVENQEVVEDAFEVGTIKRVTKAEHKKLTQALEALAEMDNAPVKVKFLQDNIEAIQTSFRWPSVKRMSDEEKDAATKNTLVAASDNEDLALYVIENKEAILEAFGAGKVKREVNPKAKAALEEYRAKKKAEKEAAEAAAE